MPTVDSSISWVLVTSPNPDHPDTEIIGHWENNHGQQVTPRIGDIVDPHTCDKHWLAALKCLGFDVDNVPGDGTFLRIRSINQQYHKPVRVRGYR
jgi:hypothetical protein